VLISPESLKQSLVKKEPLLLLDVRTPQEFAEWSIPGSVNVPMNDLYARIDDFPQDRKIVAICAHGVRSKIAAELLCASGCDAVTLQGGMANWANTFDKVPLGKGFLQVRRLGKGCVSYLIISGEQAAVIDPSLNLEEYFKLAAENGAQISHVMDTHQHADHVSGSRLLAQEAGAILHLNPAEGFRFEHAKLKDGQEIEVGNLKIQVMHTPGHTPGSTSFLVDGHLITGDTLFCDGIGRPDLHNKLEEFAGQLWETYQKKILSLPSSTKVLPAHHSQAAKIDFGEPLEKTFSELSLSLPLMNSSRDEFITYLKSNTPPKMANQLKILSINRGDVPLDPDEAAELEEGPNKCVVRA
jgi:glyoxylase-like metal-dependent hydrolase (beta-lactamase superfamily II)